MANSPTQKFLGIVITIILSFFVLLFITGAEPIQNMSTNLILSEGDGSKDFYNTYYHVKWDTSYTKNNRTSYPYGEHYTYTGVQMHVSVPLKIIQDVCSVDLSQHVLFWMNFWTLASFILCSLFLFLIFYELKINWIFALLSAVAITYISPQLERMNCHATLSYAFIIPCAIYLLLKWHNNKKWIYSIFLAILCFLSAIFHPYYLVFMGTLWAVATIYTFIAHKDKKRYTYLLHSVVQFIIPTILFLLATNIGNDSSDRSAIPYGFYIYKSDWKGILTPVGRSFPQLNLDSNWEGWSFVGYLALVMMAIGAVIAIQKIAAKKWNEAAKITDSHFLNWLFYGSVILLIYSCCIPFIWGIPQYFLHYIGPFAQFRSLGRFAWLFFYSINIISVYAIAKFLQKKSKWVTISISALIFAFFAADIYFFNSSRDFVHDVTDVLDAKNENPNNAWVNTFEANKYQSILPLPFCTHGSDHVQYNENPALFAYIDYVTTKTGLPTHASNTTRAKIHNVYANVAFAFEPYAPFPVLKDLPSKKPILIITPTNKEEFVLNDNEQRILSYATPLFTAHDINFYEINITDLEQVQKDFVAQQKELYYANKKYEITDGIYSNDSLANYYLNSFDSETGTAFQGNGAKRCNLSEWTTLYDDVSPLQHCDTLDVSFLISNYLDDLLSKTIVSVTKTDAAGHRSDIYYHCLGYFFSEEKITTNNLFNGWARIGFQIPDVAPTDRIKIVIRNFDIKRNTFVNVDNLLLKPKNTHVMSENNGVVLWNNVQPF